MQWVGVSYKASLVIRRVARTDVVRSRDIDGSDTVSDIGDEVAGNISWDYAVVTAWLFLLGEDFASVTAYTDGDSLAGDTLLLFLV